MRSMGATPAVLCAATGIGYACHLTLPSLMCAASGVAQSPSLAGYTLIIGLVRIISMLLLAFLVSGSLLHKPRVINGSMGLVVLTSLLLCALRGHVGETAIMLLETVFWTAASVPALAWIESFFAIYRVLGPSGCLAVSGACYIVNALFLTIRDALGGWMGTFALAAIVLAGAWGCLVTAARYTPSEPEAQAAGSLRQVSAFVPARLAMVLLVLGLTWKLTNQFVGQQGILWDAGGFSAWGVVLGGLLAGAVLLMVPHGRVPAFGLLLRWAIALTGIAWLLAPYCAQSAPLVASTLACATYVFQGALMPCLIAGVCYGNSIAVCPAAALMLSLFRIGGLLGTALQMALGTVAPEGEALHLLSVACASVLFLLVPLVPSRVAGAEVLAMERYPEEQDPLSDLEAAVRAVADKAGLTDRETDVLALLFYGKKREEIADELGISPWTVKRHVGKIFDKTGVHSVSELIGSTASAAWRFGGTSSTSSRG